MPSLNKFHKNKLKSLQRLYCLLAENPHTLSNQGKIQSLSQRQRRKEPQKQYVSS